MTSGTNELPEATRSILESRFGLVGRARRVHSANHGAAVWRARLGDRRDVFIKQHPASRRFLNERDALRNWAPALNGAAPQLIAAIDPPARILVVSACPGKEVASCPALESKDENEIFSIAATTLLTLHSIPLIDTDPMSVSDAIHHRLEGWLSRASRLLNLAAREEFMKRFGDPHDFAFANRSPCHRDFTPSNWIAERSAPGGWRVRVIDFEHARPDWALVDFVKLEAEVWNERPELRHAFFEGYGRALDEAEEDALGRLLLLHGLATAVWGAEHSDSSFMRRGRRILASAGIDV